MKKTIHKLKKIKKQKNSPFAMVAVVAAVAIIGGSLIIQSHAATFATSKEAESGTVAGNAATVTGSSASGGSAVKFGASSGGGGGSGSRTCTSPSFTSSDPEGTWNTPDGYLVQNDMWNGDSQIAPQSQTIYGCSSSNISVVSNMTNQGGEVKTYPDVGALYNGSPKALSAYQNITSTFSESIPALGEWDAAYDVWTNNWAHELMIWNNTHEHPEIPPSGSTAVTIDGVAYHEWHSGETYIAFMRDTPVDSGSVNILDVYKWLETQGLAAPSDTLIELEYGVEISATESSPGVQGPETFNITGWSLTAN